MSAEPATSERGSLFVPLTITTSDGPAQVYAERTTNAWLFITPGTSDGRYGMHFSITHGPTGLALIWDSSPDKLRAYADKLAHLDWASFTTKEQFASDELKPLRDEARQLLRDSSWTDPSAVELPAHDHRGNGKDMTIARAAVPQAIQALEALQKGYERLHGDGDEGVPLDIPDPDSERGVKANPEWMFWCIRNGLEFTVAYLLLVLHRVDPPAADSAAAWLADQYEWGDGMGEHAWDWHQALIKGQPLDLPGVPHFGALLADHATGETR